MVTVGRGLTESYPAVAASVPLARAVVGACAERAGLTTERVDAVRLAVTEAVTNAVRHAYPDREGVIEVTTGLVGDDELWVFVADHGCGQQARSRDPGLGFGLGLMAEVCDEFVVAERAQGGTEVRMCFRLDVVPPRLL